MHPIISIFGVDFAAHDLFVVLAAVTSLVLGPLCSARIAGLEVHRMRRAFVVLVVVALAGGRLHFLVNSAASFRRHPFQAFNLLAGPFHVPGAIIALVAALPWTCRRYGLPLGRFADGGVPVVGMALAIARFGCFLQGCCFGRVCTAPWCIAFPRGSNVFLAHAEAGRLPPDATHSLPVHPLQLYFLGTAILVTAMSLLLNRTKRFDGEVTLAAMVVFSATSLGLEFVRSDEMFRVYWGPLPQLAWTTLAMTVMSIAALVAAEVSHARRSEARLGDGLRPVPHG